MGVDGTCRALTAHVACERNPHPSARRFGEEGPWEGWHRLVGGVRLSWCWRALHSWSSCPATARCCTYHQSHSHILSIKKERILHYNNISSFSCSCSVEILIDCSLYLFTILPIWHYEEGETRGVENFAYEFCVHHTGLQGKEQLWIL